LTRRPHVSRFRFDRSYSESERSMARRQSALQNLIVLIKAAVAPF
jgi:hypothetical protein